LTENLDDYPEYWTDIENLSYKTKIFNIVNVDLNSLEAKTLIAKFTETIRVADIIRIERIQNLVAFNKYLEEYRLMKHKYDGEEIEIQQYKFHGTKDTDPFKLIESEEGFDKRLARSGKWGSGLYFLESA
jgi:hypothetical protein